MTTQRRLQYCAILCVAFCFFTLLSAGCNRSTSGGTFRMHLSGAVENLDPQFATDPDARLLILNLYEGLLARQEDGSLSPGTAESFEVSPDGLTYTFTLRDGVCWQDGTPLLASDFLYSFQRIFGLAGISPHASDFTCIDGAREILSGTAPLSSLGVAAPDDRTVVFQLAHPDETFPGLLATAPAMPCNEDLFKQSRGRYGLELKFVYSNGPFTLERWDNTRYLLLGRSDTYVSDSAALPDKVYLYTAGDDPSAQFLAGKSDVSIITADQAEAVQNAGATIRSSQKTVWCIVFNQDDPVWGNALLRQGFAHTVDIGTLRDTLPDTFSLTQMFVPPALTLLDTSYRDLAGDIPPLKFDPERGEYLFELGLDLLERTGLPQTVILIPEFGIHALPLGLLQQGWQTHLGAYINISRASDSLMQSRLLSGDYQMMLLPFVADSPDPASILGNFSSFDSRNRFGYRNVRFDLALHSAREQGGLPETAKSLKSAEDMLLLDAAVIPLYFETTHYALAQGVSGILIISPGNTVLFKYAQK